MESQLLDDDDERTNKQTATKQPTNTKGFVFGNEIMENIDIAIIHLEGISINQSDDGNLSCRFL